LLQLPIVVALTQMVAVPSAGHLSKTQRVPNESSMHDAP